MKKLPLVSVVIAVKNEEENIGRCLESLRKQTYPQKNIEIIVIDNDSADKTVEIAGKYTDKVFNLAENKSLRGIKNFRGAQVNFGVKQCKGEIVFFPDADMTFDFKLIGEAVDLILKKRIDALYIPEKICGKGLFGKVRDFERGFYDATCIDAVRIVKKDVYIKRGGFDEKNIMFGSDDWDFTKRVKSAGAKIGLASRRIYHHEEQMTLIRYLGKKKMYSGMFAGYIKKWGKKDTDVCRQFSPFYRGFLVFTENGKWRKLVSHPLLAAGMLGLKFFVGLIYIFSK